jgi:MoxR-like ATPase
VIGPNQRSGWDSPDNTDHLLGRTPTGRAERLPDGWWRESLKRLLRLRDSLRNDFIGLDEIIDWLLAVIIARENGLLLGTPGVAKSQIATRMFELLDLKVPPKPKEELLISLASGGNPWEIWQRREQEERQTHKQFHYLLSRFAQMEELFGPIEIDLLRKGLLVRVNFGLLTGKGVRGAFLDEIFKASASILNALLTLTQERRYFNWGGMVESDLLFFIGASNELPGALGGLSSGADDFQQSYAFLDRFPVRLLVPVASGSNELEPGQSDLAKAFDFAFKREIKQFSRGSAFPGRDPYMPTINDIICLGRSMLEAVDEDGLTIYHADDLRKFHRAFVATSCHLQVRGTDAPQGQLTWTISPRKLRALYKIALAHALVTGDDCIHAGAQRVALGARQMRVFRFIWDSPHERLRLESEIDQVEKAYGR